MLIANYKKKIKPLFQQIEIYKRDISNKLIYGRHAPKHLERIWINPMDVELLITGEEVKRVTGMSRQMASGVVIDWDLIKSFEPIENDFRYQYSHGRWVLGKSWEELGVYEYMKNETKKYKHMSHKQLEERYNNFEILFNKIKSDGRLKTRKELNKMNFREKDGILIHVGKNGELFFGGIGFHRFSIAKILKLEKIPACVGVVDKNSIKFLNKLRIKS